MYGIPFMLVELLVFGLRQPCPWLIYALLYY
jgi:hypothetical protein